MSLTDKQKFFIHHRSGFSYYNERGICINVPGTDEYEDLLLEFIQQYPGQNRHIDTNIISDRTVKDFLEIAGYNTRIREKILSSRSISKSKLDEFTDYTEGRIGKSVFVSDADIIFSLTIDSYKYSVWDDFAKESYEIVLSNTYIEPHRLPFSNASIPASFWRNFIIPKYSDRPGFWEYFSETMRTDPEFLREYLTEMTRDIYRNKHVKLAIIQEWNKIHNRDFDHFYNYTEYEFEYDEKFFLKVYNELDCDQSFFRCDWISRLKLRIMSSTTLNLLLEFLITDEQIRQSEVILRAIQNLFKYLDENGFKRILTNFIRIGEHDRFLDGNEILGEHFVTAVTARDNINRRITFINTKTCHGKRIREMIKILNGLYVDGSSTKMTKFINNIFDHIGPNFKPNFIRQCIENDNFDSRNILSNNYCLEKWVAEERWKLLPRITEQDLTEYLSRPGKRFYIDAKREFDSLL